MSDPIGRGHAGVRGSVRAGSSSTRSAKLVGSKADDIAHQSRNEDIRVSLGERRIEALRDGGRFRWGTQGREVFSQRGCV